VTTRRRETLLALETEIVSIGRRLRHKMQAVAAELSPGLGMNAYAVLGSLAVRGSSRQTDLAELVGIDKAGMSRLAAELIALDLIQRETDPTDGRVQLLSLSPYGRSRIEEIRGRRERFYIDRLSDWSDAELDELVSVLGRYNEAFSKETASLTPAAT
jgi:DNA-binding MarR family transcriptional regulator